MSYNNIDKKIANIYHAMMNRCYNSSDKSYARYGARGVTVCDEWKNDIAKFIKDFKTLPGYDDWLVAPDDCKYLYQIDKDMKQFDKPMNERVYSKDTCVIVHTPLNSRLSAIQNNDSKSIGVSLTADGTWAASIRSNNIRYRLGIYSSKLAAESIYNYVARHLPNPILNDLGESEMNVEEALNFLVSHKPLTIPSGIEFPEFANNSKRINIIYEGSKYDGVRKTVNSTYIACGVDGQTINEYANEIAAAYAVNQNYINHGLPAPNDLKFIVSEEGLEHFRIKSQAEKKKDLHTKTILRRFSKYKIGTKFVNGDGSTFTVIGLPEVDEVVGRYFPVRIKFDGTGTELTISSGSIDHCKEHPIRDYNKPSVCNIGFTGMPNIPKDECIKFLYTMWHNVLIMCYDTSAKGFVGCKIDPRWHSFANFLKDVKTLSGYDEFIKNGYDGYTIENRSLQPNMDPKDRVWSKDTCTIITKFENRSRMWNEGTYSKQSPLPKGVSENPSTGYTARIKNGGSIMAGAAADYYSKYMNHRSLNGLSEQIPPYEWQQHKSRMQKLYHVVQRPLYSLTNEDEEVRRERCKRLYGIEI